LLPSATGSSNVGQATAQFGSSYIQQMNAATLNITSQTFLTNVTIASNLSTPLANITTLNTASAIATTGFYGPVVGSNTMSATVITASTNVNTPLANITHPKCRHVHSYHFILWPFDRFQHHLGDGHHRLDKRQYTFG
jgi:phage-related protein